MLTTVLYILYGILLIYCVAAVLYLLFFSLSGKFFYRTPFHTAGEVKWHKIAVLVPAYREDGIIESTAVNLLQLRYPREFFDVYIIADSFQPETVATLKRLPVYVLEVSFDKSTKTKSLNEAFSRIEKQYDVALICDADNMLARNFLERVNAAFASGARAVQGRRVAKNLDTSFAILDACSEGINNHIFRQGYNGAGLSSAVIGSGMAFGFEELKNILKSVRAVGGFDKILQLEIIRRGNKIWYLNDAYAFDEKVSSSGAFRQQRKRWVSSQFIYFRQFFATACKQLAGGNFSYFNLAVLCNLILPRAFFFLVLPVFVVLSFLAGSFWGWLAVVVTLLYLVALAIAVPRELVNRKLLSAVLQLPKAVLVMAGTVLHVRKSNKTFIHTVHTKTEVTNATFSEKAQ